MILTAALATAQTRPTSGDYGGEAGPAVVVTAPATGPDAMTLLQNVPQMGPNQGAGFSVNTAYNASDMATAGRGTPEFQAPAVAAAKPARTPAQLKMDAKFDAQRAKADAKTAKRQAQAQDAAAQVQRTQELMTYCLRLANIPIGQLTSTQQSTIRSCRYTGLLY